jgi:hypothetical protein
MKDIQRARERGRDKSTKTEINNEEGNRQKGKQRQINGLRKMVREGEIDKNKKRGNRKKPRDRQIERKNKR